jgi:hypothetical protein
MAKSFMQEIETVLKARVPGQMETLLFYYGIPLKIFEQKQNLETSVYGTSSGNIQNTFLKEIHGILVSTDFFESDNSYAGDFEQGFLYTMYPDVPVGSYVQVDRMDDKIKRFKINNLKTIGITTGILHRYEILAVGN